MYMFISLVFVFPLVETKRGNVSSVDIPIMRDAGRFGHVSIEWRVDTTDSLSDLTPSSGVVSFQPAQDLAVITISSVDDQVSIIIVCYNS